MLPDTTTARPTLTELFQAWQAGSRRSGDRFFRAVKGRLAGYAQALARDDSAEDLLQDVFLTFVQHAEGFETSGGDGAIVAWFQTTLRRRHWAMSHRAGREIPVADVSERADVSQHDAMAPVEDRMEASARLGTLRAAAAPRSGARFHHATRTCITALADHLEAVLIEGAQPVVSSGALAAKVGWTPFQLWQMSHRLEEAVAPRPALVTSVPVSVPDSSGAEFPIAPATTADLGEREPTRAPVLSAAHRVSAPETVTSGCSRESVRVELGAGARTPTHRRAPASAGQSRRRPPDPRALMRRGPSEAAGCRAGPPRAHIEISAYREFVIRREVSRASM